MTERGSPEYIERELYGRRVRIARPQAAPAVSGSLDPEAIAATISAAIERRREERRLALAALMGPRERAADLAPGGPTTARASTPRGEGANLVSPHPGVGAAADLGERPPFADSASSFARPRLPGEPRPLPGPGKPAAPVTDVVEADPEDLTSLLRPPTPGPAPALPPTAPPPAPTPPPAQSLATGPLPVTLPATPPAPLPAPRPVLAPVASAATSEAWATVVGAPEPLEEPVLPAIELPTPAPPIEPPGLPAINLPLPPGTIPAQITLAAPENELVDFVVGIAAETQALDQARAADLTPADESGGEGVVFGEIHSREADLELARPSRLRRWASRLAPANLLLRRRRRGGAALSVEPVGAFQATDFPVQPPMSVLIRGAAAALAERQDPDRPAAERPPAARRPAAVGGRRQVVAEPSGRAGGAVARRERTMIVLLSVVVTASVSGFILLGANLLVRPPSELPSPSLVKATPSPSPSPTPTVVPTISPNPAADVVSLLAEADLPESLVPTTVTARSPELLALAAEADAAGGASVTGRRWDLLKGATNTAGVSSLTDARFTFATPAAAAVFTDRAGASLGQPGWAPSLVSPPPGFDAALAYSSTDRLPHGVVAVVRKGSVVVVLLISGDKRLSESIVGSLLPRLGAYSNSQPGQPG